MDAFQICGYTLLFLTYHYSNKRIVDLYREKIGDSNYKIYKNGLSDDALLTAFFPDRTIDDIIFYEEYLDTEYPDELRDIFSKFVNYVDPLNLEYSLVNLNSVKVCYEKKLNLLFDCYTMGYYDSFRNKITLISKNKKILSHEFLHMASSSYYNPLFCGFHIVNEGISEFGNGLNEGYTELLNSRIFYDGKSPRSYEFNVGIVRLLECFYSDYRDMEWAYFHNDINSVYKEFCKYGTRDEFFLVMNELDKLSKGFVPMDIISYYKLKFKLYEIIKRSDDKEKIEKFEDIFYDSKMDYIISKTGIDIGNIGSFSKEYIKKIG